METPSIASCHRSVQSAPACRPAAFAVLLRAGLRVSLCGLAVAALGACNDPFKFDTSKIGAGGAGNVTPDRPGSGGAAGAGAESNTGGSGTATGGSGSNAAGGAAGAPAPTAGATGGTPATGTGGGNGQPPADAAPPATTPDARPDATRPPPDLRPSGPPPVIKDCPADPPAPPGADVSCPAILRELDSWFPVTPPVSSCKPPAHPETECRFYQFSWQNFLIATQPDAQGKPAFLNWSAIENVFGATAGSPVPAVPLLSGGVTQAGGRQVLIDQRGHAIHYGIHMNQLFVDFVNEHGLTTAEAIKAADPELGFPADVVELKEAWQIVDDAAPPTNYIVARVKVPTLAVDPASQQVVEDRSKTREVTAALIAIHVVYTLPGHPEFIWSTFEHVNAQGITDVAPSAIGNPDVTRDTTVINRLNHVLYRGGTAAGGANRAVSLPQLDPLTQTFVSPPTSIYRMYTASKSNLIALDDDVVSINGNMTARFAAAHLPAYDRRQNYRLVGAIWQDRPDLTFKTNKVLVNDDNDPDIKVNGGDSPKSITGGEDRLSSTAMESFTQGADSFPNCFQCHDTRATTARGVPSARDQGATVLLAPKQINVSHIFNEVVRMAP